MKNTLLKKTVSDTDKRGISAFSLIVIILASLVYWFLSLNFSRNIPYWDEWEYTEYVAGTRPVTLNYLIAPHNEHRIVIQNLIVLGLAKLTRWNIHYENILSALIIFISYILFNLLIIDKLPLPYNQKQFVYIFSALCLLTPAQIQNMVFGFQMSWGLIQLFMFSIISLLPIIDDHKENVIWIIVLCILSTLSSMHGLIPGLYLIPYFVIKMFQEKKARFLYILFICIFIAITGAYFIGLPTNNANIVKALHRGLRIPFDIINMTGYPYFYFAHKYSPAIGLLFAGILITCFIINAKKKGFFRELINLYMENPLIMFGIIFITLILIGRASWASATASRYVTFTILLNIGIFFYLIKTIKLAQVTQTIILVILAVFFILNTAFAYSSYSKQFKTMDATVEELFASAPNFNNNHITALYPDKNSVESRLKILYNKKLSVFCHNKSYYLYKWQILGKN